MKKLIITLIVLAAVAGSVGAYYKYRGGDAEAKVSTLPVTRGEIIEAVGASGTLQAVNTVQVGTQVSGIIKALHADFNSIVHKGQVVAELDPSLFQTQIEQARANLARSEADMDRLKVSLDDARTKLKRTQELSARKLVATQDLEAAEVAVRAADAQIKSAQAQVVQAQASLNQNQVNLQHTIIQAPIDGIVISRNVDVGQTVAASMQAPTIFIIAADLTKMQVNASVDESDVGRIRPGQHVRFRVDAYPTDEFIGTVSQVRLQPVTVQNVVTYATVIDVPNPQLKLKPGMTANVTIEVARRENVLRIPNAALRFRPTADVFAALNLPVPPDLQRGTGGLGAQRPGAAAGGPGGAGTTAGGATANTPAGAPAAAAAARPRGGQAAGTPAPATTAGQTARAGQGGPGGPGSGANLSAEERRQRFQERMQNMSPEEREQFVQRMRERGIDPANPGAGGRPGAPGSGGAPAAGGRAATASSRPLTAAASQTIDSLFGPLPVTESSGRAWLWVGGQLKMVRLRLGISDGTYTELLSGEVQPGVELVTQVLTPAQAAAGGPTRSPLMPGRPGMPGGGRPGGH